MRTEKELVRTISNDENEKNEIRKTKSEKMIISGK